MAFSEYVKDKFEHGEAYVKALLKWSVLSVFIGALCGAAGIVFHYGVEYASEARERFPYLLFFLPLSGVMIAFLYSACHMQNDKGTNTVINSIRSGEKPPAVMAPLIFLGTVLTHLCGGSSGREGAALQIGGSISSSVGTFLRLPEKDMHVMIMCGMSALFSAVFGTPLTSAIFSMEVISVGIIYYNAFFPCLASALTARFISRLAGVPEVSFSLSSMPESEPLTYMKIILLSVLTAAVSVLFIVFMHNFSRLYLKYIKSGYIRAFLGGGAVVIITLLLGTRDYNGVGMEVIRRAVEGGEAEPLAFLLKMLLTVLTLSSGFKGGEIVPSFFIGSTFGVLVSPIVGLDPSFSAAIGLVALFCGVVNCPIASVILSVELFGSGGVLFFALASAVSYIMSGYYSLYSGQKIIYSKLESTYINKGAK